MNTATIRQKLHSYLELADEKKVKAIYTMVEDEINLQNDFVLSEEQLGILEKEREKHLSGKSKSYTWEEVKKKLEDKRKP